MKLQKLKEGEFYNKELVYDVLFDAQELDVDSLRRESRKFFLQGIDLYKNN